MCLGARNDASEARQRISTLLAAGAAKVDQCVYVCVEEVCVGAAGECGGPSGLFREIGNLDSFSLDGIQNRKQNNEKKNIVPIQNLHKARGYFRRATMLGHAAAARMLATMHATGIATGGSDAFAPAIGLSDFESGSRDGKFATSASDNNKKTVNSRKGRKKEGEMLASILTPEIDRNDYMSSLAKTDTTKETLLSIALHPHYTATAVGLYHLAAFSPTLEHSIQAHVQSEEIKNTPGEKKFISFIDKFSMRMHMEKIKSLLSLGFRYMRGYGVPQSCEAAAWYYASVAESAHTEVRIDQPPRRLLHFTYAFISVFS